jgi:hypothetical protein
MPGMGGGHLLADGSLWAVAVILALFMIGYVMWTADQLTALVRARVPHQRGTVALAPRLAACYKIAMGIAMGYMLILMF